MSQAVRIDVYRTNLSVFKSISKLVSLPSSKLIRSLRMYARTGVCVCDAQKAEKEAEEE